MGALTAHSVRYNGTVVNRSMFSAISLFGEKYSDASVELLRKIEQKSGRIA